MDSEGIIVCSAWVPRGVAKREPTKIELTPEEMEKLMKETEEQLRDATLQSEDQNEDNDDDDDDDENEDEDHDDDNNEKNENNLQGDDNCQDDTPQKDKMDDANDDPEDEEIVKEFGLETYDEEAGMSLSGAGMGNIRGLTYFSNNSQDPYITLEEDDGEDDFAIETSDNLLAIGRIDEGIGRIEIHDMMLSSFPVCMDWVGFDPGNEDDNRGNLLAVGTMEPQIELWDLDVLEAPEPAVYLGRPTKTRKGKKKYPGHKDAVLGLAWNRGQRSLLASGSADKTVRLWDLNSAECLRTYTHHTNKVELVRWNPKEVSVLATAAHGGSVQIFDTRTPDAVANWSLDSDIECLEWCPWDPTNFIAGTAYGTVYKCSVQNPGLPVFTLNAHDSAVSSLAVSPMVSGLLATASPDESVKIWDIQGDPSLVLSKDYDLGAVFSVSFCPDSGYQLACGGHHGGVKIVHLAESGPVLRRFRERNLDVSSYAEQLAARISEKRKHDLPIAEDDDEADGGGFE
eukprot:gene507-3833_t